MSVRNIHVLVVLEDTGFVHVHAFSNIRRALEYVDHKAQEAGLVGEVIYTPKKRNYLADLEDTLAILNEEPDGVEYHYNKVPVYG